MHKSIDVHVKPYIYSALYDSKVNSEVSPEEIPIHDEHKKTL